MQPAKCPIPEKISWFYIECILISDIHIKIGYKKIEIFYALFIFV